MDEITKRIEAQRIECNNCVNSFLELIKKKVDNNGNVDYRWIVQEFKSNGWFVKEENDV